ncbi:MULTISPECIES: phosphohistidine phosphatase SixA [Moraxella]|uniref:Phosphohistidine phosphatase n=1 Tax=Moraxella lacunata TaxID=477 RepID=A0A1B8Q3V3_MORLA|nr:MULTISPECIES: phosphohistidine phosphatase SixA [Moraxella]MBE9578258.1 phosphohistidine phosphatase SixA [Moraxella sp. K1664]MBE9587344.1 phosphohistidine phosphatase SixA [Moraxella sp. K1630]MBE9590287.1 phosphohistidine phosphatase SixA [Moraxella sp. K127]MBE9595916.1 phosphohistidine phosphatase SixA [Moraxella sp. K2450]MDH9219023.1 phosphohistidine phosphatase SixA [Moraxella lacunata]
MKLIFIRHGQATAYCADDAGRDLTEFGQAQANQTATHLTERYSLDMIIASPFNRADQTAKILQNIANNKGQNPTFITLGSITPDDDPVAGVADIEQIITSHYGHEHDKTIAVVCHMPIVARMVAYLDTDGLPPPMFDLAEYRVMTADVIAQGLARQSERFSPVQP